MGKDSELAGKVVLVTGASSGIGWATALAFARRGCRVALAARRAAKLSDLAGLVRAEGGEDLEVSCDVRDRAQTGRAVEAVVARWGSLDVLVNNAGILETKAFERQDEAVIEDMLRTNVLGAVYALKAVLPHMRRRGSGHVVNVASVAGLVGLPYMAAYCASKFALVGLTEALRRELHGSGITLTAFCPGTVDTPMAAPSLKDPRVQKAARPKTPEQVAERIVRATLDRAPEVVYGEAPAFLLRASKFFPRLSDRAVSAAWSRVHPVARRERR